ncbi:MAG: hypothetical protein JXA46_04185 [Dehalococcoidales bacterium]|nr:hypothetical protein [Dehalococcoidales bacterium]
MSARWNNAGSSPDKGNEDWKTAGEGSYQNRRTHKFYDDPLRGLFWGLLLILIGVLFFINQQGDIVWDVLWKYLLIGLGSIFIIDGIARSLHPAYRAGGLGKFVPGIILVLVGVAFLFNFSQFWPVILIAVGAVMLISILVRRR